jgi:arginyl-tRNA synthetase
MLKDFLTKNLAKNTGLSIEIKPTSNFKYGDYFTNAAMRFKIDPNNLIKKIDHSIFEKVEVVPPGFINFYLSNSFLFDQLDRFLKNYLKPLSIIKSSFNKKKISVEFTDPNPFKEFHLGHLYTNTVGEALARIFEILGARVKRMSYHGDVGLHVAKAVWGAIKLMEEEKISLEDLKKRPLAERINFLGKAYVFGFREYDLENRAREEIIRINKEIFSLGKNNYIKKVYSEGKKWSLMYFEKIYKRLGTKFDFYYFEKDTSFLGLKLVKKYLEKGVFEISEGAIVFPGDKYGLHKRVFVNSQGLPTYEAKELGLAFLKNRDFKADNYFIVTANEVSEYFKVVLSALRLIDPILAEKIIHVPHGIVRLKTGKMSSREGNVIKAEDFLDRVKKKIKRENVSDSLSEKIMLGAVKYYFLKVGLGKDIIFDIDASLDIKGDSGVYLQYTYTRFKSILRKVKNQNHKKIIGKTKKDLNIDSLERKLLIEILRFPEVILDAGKTLSPNLVANHLYSLSLTANEFYHKNQILREKEEEKRNFRIKLVFSLLSVLEKGLKVLGIPLINKM